MRTEKGETMPKRYIDAFALIEYANNLKDKTIDANDIARFPTARSATCGV